MSLPQTTSKMNKLLMKLIIAAARGDKDKVYNVALEIVKLFEEGLEEGEGKKND
ncbi:MAG: hypothetical protein QXF50_02440 [Sulfolobales archaeon]